MKVIAFDVDGTVLNTLETIIHYTNESLEDKNYKRVDDKEYIRKTLGYGSLYLVEKALDFNNAKYTKEEALNLLDYYTNKYNANPAYLSEIYPGVEELIKTLKNEGYTVIAYSNKPDNVLQGLMAEKFEEGLFDHIEGKKIDAPSKPDPTVLNKIINMYGIEKEDIVYIGDSEVDIETAKNAGIASIAVSWGFRDRDFLEKVEPDFIADTAEQVKECIDNLRG